MKKALIVSFFILTLCILISSCDNTTNNELEIKVSDYKLPDSIIDNNYAKINIYLINNENSCYKRKDREQNLETSNEDEEVLQIEKQIDKKFRELDYNIEVDFYFINAYSYKEKINKMLKAGEDMDLIYFTSNLADLDTDRLYDFSDTASTYMPQYYSNCVNMIEQLYTEDKKLYSLPDMLGYVNKYCVLIPQNILNKYDGSTISNFDEYNWFLEYADKKGLNKEKVSLFYNIRFDSLIQSGRYEHPTFSRFHFDVYDRSVKGGKGLFLHGLVFDKETDQKKLLCYEDTEEYQKYFKYITSWLENDYFISYADEFESADILSVLCLVMDVPNIQGYFPDKDWTFHPLNDKYETTKDCNGFFASPNYAEHEKAMIVLEMLYMNQDINNIFTYGVEEMHYTINKRGVMIKNTNERFRTKDKFKCFINREYYYQRSTLDSYADYMIEKSNNSRLTLMSVAEGAGYISNMDIKKYCDEILQNFQLRLMLTCYFENFIKDHNEQSIKDLIVYIKLLLNCILLVFFS